MKKILMTLTVAVMAISANAQVYVGGGFGVASASVDGGDDVTTYKFVPEVGYAFNDEWAAGVAFGWEGASEGAKTVSVNPYVRWTFVKSGRVSAFVDGSFEYDHIYGNGADIDGISFGLKPGLAVGLTNHLSFVTHIGFLGYENAKDNNTDIKVDTWGLDLDGRNITFGLYYSF
ncbi:MAG: outer membrane beta-barrel protein [Prevotella sp.]|nr:outer membrane beta-barrel protein [Prevotella sp.]